MLVIVMAPRSLPAIVGEYVTFKVALAPGLIVAGVVMPATPNGPPFTLIKESVKLEPPMLLTVAVPFPMLPTAMVPKFRLSGFRLICCGAGVAVPDRTTCSVGTLASVMIVSVAVTLPGELGSNET